MRFSDESHDDYDDVDRIYVIRKSDMRACSSCIQHTVFELEEERDRKRKHFWAAVDYNFKSPLVFYDVSDNKNDKMSLQVYRDSILESVVKSWIEHARVNKYSFTLEENDDSKHDTRKSNICRTWKRENDLNYYFNCSDSSDLVSIENCWQELKSWAKRTPHWDDETTESLLAEGWDEHVSQRFINKHMRSMPQRLRDVIELEGQMTGY